MGRVVKHFTSDPHLGHEMFIRTGIRDFKDVQEMDELIIHRMIEPLKPGDELYCVGDLGFSVESIKLFMSRFPKNCMFNLVRGNHDKKAINILNNSNFKYNYYEMCETKIMVDGLWHHIVMHHFPMAVWPRSHRGAWMLHGHLHDNEHGKQYMEKCIGKTLNVNCEFHDYRPWSEAEIIEVMSTKEDNWDLIPGSWA